MSRKLKRTGTIEINTPVYAKNIARYAIESAKETEKGRTYALITARVFTAFMVEGALDHLGRVLCSEWDIKTEKYPRSLSRQLTAQEKHKLVRRKIGLSNGDKEFCELRDSLIIPLFEFRDGLAHPKLRSEDFEEEIESEIQNHPPTEWEKELTLEQVENECTDASKYCYDLFDKTATMLNEESGNMVEFLRKYSHIDDVGCTVCDLQSFWHISQTANASITSEQS